VLSSTRISQRSSSSGTTSVRVNGTRSLRSCVAAPSFGASMLMVEIEAPSAAEGTG